MKTKFRIILSLPDLILSIEMKDTTNLDAELTYQSYCAQDITIITISCCYVKGEKRMFNFQF
jgi:hypothetical protein